MSIRKFILAAFAAVCCGTSWAQAILSEKTQKLFNDFFDLRMNVSKLSERAEILAVIDGFSELHKEEVAGLNEQELLVLENFVVMERYNYLYEDPAEKKGQHIALGIQREKCEKFVKEHNEKDLSAWFWVTYGDVVSCYMGYSVADVLKYGAKVKPLYDKALDLGNPPSYILTNVAQWYYFAPKIIGGSKKKALENFEEAAKVADTDSRKYFAYSFLSQMLFEEKEFERSAKLLDEAESFCPGSLYIKRIRFANSKNLSIFEYNKEVSALNEEYESGKNEKK